MSDDVSMSALAGSLAERSGAIFAARRDMDLSAPQPFDRAAARAELDALTARTSTASA